MGMAGKGNGRRERDWLASEEESLCSARLPLRCNHQEHSSVKERVQEFQTQVKFMPLCGNDKDCDKCLSQLVFNKLLFKILGFRWHDVLGLLDTFYIDFKDLFYI